MRPSIALLACLAACADPGPVSPPAVAEHVETLVFGADDNSEVIKLLPDGRRAVLIASKARRLTLIEVRPDGLAERQSVVLFPDDPSESELTHVDFAADGRFAAITRTLPRSVDGVVTDCAGEVVFVDVTPGAGFGAMLNRVAVGPMPDAIDLSSDDRWAVTADEVDYNDGKCPVAAIRGSVSVIELPDGDPLRARVRARIRMDETATGGRREPEQIHFAPDDDRVAVTLQDTHEVLFFRRSAVLGADDTIAELAAADLTITRYPDRPDGAEPWPDGVHVLRDAAGRAWFVAAGEYNDTLAIFDLDGGFVGQHRIDPADMPDDLPRNLESWSAAPFRPDSLAFVEIGGRALLAASLKHAGAIGLWDVGDPTTLRLHAVVKIGAREAGTPTTESSLGTEGISAGVSGGVGVVLTANEGESSVSLVRVGGP